MFFFFFNDTATTEIYTLSLHDALPDLWTAAPLPEKTPDTKLMTGTATVSRAAPRAPSNLGDRKSTRLNSSHANISYAVFCLKKRRQHNTRSHRPTVNRSPPVPIWSDSR